MNSMFLIGFGLAILSVIVGMACVIVAFIVFRPIVSVYANAVAAKLKAAEKTESVDVARPSLIKNTKQSKKDDRTIKRPVRDAEEEISL